MIFRTIGKSLVNTGAKYQSTVWTGSECGEGSLEVNVPVPARLEVDSISRLQIHISIPLGAVHRMLQNLQHDT